MLYVIDNEQPYDMHELYFVESDIEPLLLRQLLKAMGPSSRANGDPHPYVVLMTDNFVWGPPNRLGSREMAVFDGRLWRLGDSESAEFDTEEEARQRKLMATALRAESNWRLSIWARHADGAYGSDHTVPARAVVEMERRFPGWVR